MGPWRIPVWPADLELQDDLTPAEWILPRLRPWGIGGGTGVGSIVPNGFSAYIRLLHPAGTGGIDPPVRWREVAEANRRIYHPLMQWRQIKEPEAGAPGVGRLSDPWTGDLTLEDCQALYDFLAGWTSTPEVGWVGIWEGFGSLGAPSGGSVSVMTAVASDRPRSDEDREMAVAMASWEEAADRVRRAPRFDHPGRAYLLARGPIRTVSELNEFPLNITAPLVWPDDHAWLVGSEIDFDSTLIAASRECADALLADDRFETVEVHEEDRLDWGGDVLNSPVDY